MFLNQLFTPINIFIFFSEVIFILWLIGMVNNKHFKNFLNNYNETQKIHDGFISKLGGLAFLFSLVLYLFIVSEKENISFLNYAILSSLPVILIGTLEDFFNNTRPRTRLNAIFLSAFILVQYPAMILPEVSLPFLSHFFLIFPVTFFVFLIISMTVLVNGINMIDGVNGLMLTCVFFIILILFGISVKLDDPDFVNFYSLILLILLSLLIFNFPFQKIFTGDMGAYLLGLLVGFSVILLYGKHPEQITWEVPLILFYPVYEVLFTIIRRLKNKQKTTKADTDHLHQKIFFYYKSKFHNQKVANNLVMPTLMPILITPFLIFYFQDFALSFNQAIFTLVFMIFLYQIYLIVFSKLAFFGNHK